MQQLFQSHTCDGLRGRRFCRALARARLRAKPGTIAPFEAGFGTAAFLVEAADPAQLLPVKL